MYNVIYYSFFIGGTLLVGLRIYLYIRKFSDISRIYHELKSLILENQKHFLDSNFDLKFLDDRTYEPIVNGDLKEFILQNIEDEKTKNSMVHLIYALRLELKYREDTRHFTSNIIPAYKPLNRRVTYYCLYIGLACLISSWIVHPNAEAETLNKYKSKGINSIEERHQENITSESISIPIKEKKAIHHFFSGYEYIFVLDIEDLGVNNHRITVSPTLYEKKSTGDLVNVECKYITRTDRYKNNTTHYVEYIKLLD
ncbi:hypothetical protein NE686_17835 [Tissierella carlieri]|uniref:Uncharacterized protein n=1 Tax=Tissierella carlieri TaxID=689904 RepID=A0ABT1SEQ8_9FIRM|nr:hypothetical protein [Tissierella carlieri]MCQ4924966.1 hypothetical protein [Tissierella carlieri]